MLTIVVYQGGFVLTMEGCSGSIICIIVAYQGRLTFTIGGYPSAAMVFVEGYWNRVILTVRGYAECLILSLWQCIEQVIFGTWIFIERT